MADFNPQWGSAIASIESGGEHSPYSSITPNPNGRRALGKYQVMEENLPEWTQAALGKRLTAQEYLANPDAQEAVFKHRFGSYVDKYGNPQDAASAWFTGRPQATGGSARDVLGTTGAGYVAKFNKYLGAPQGALSYASTGAPVANDTEDAPALSTRAQLGAGVLVPGAARGDAGPPQQGYDWRNRIMTASALLRDDPEAAKVGLAAANPTAKDTGTYSLGPIDPQTGIGLRIHNKTGQVTTFQAQQPKEDDATKAYKVDQAKQFSDLNKSIAADASKAQSALSNIDTLRTALADPNVYQGSNGDTVAKLKNVGASLGIQTDGLENTQVAQALINKMVQESRTLNGGMPGSLSDKDLVFLKDANVGLSKSPEANQRILDIYEKLHNTALERNKDRVEYTKGGKMLDDNFNTLQAQKYAERKAAQDAADKAAEKANPAATTSAAPKTALPKGVRSIQVISQ